MAAPLCGFVITSVCVCVCVQCDPLRWSCSSCIDEMLMQSGDSCGTQVIKVPLARKKYSRTRVHPAAQ